MTLNSMVYGVVWCGVINSTHLEEMSKMYITCVFWKGSATGMDCTL